MGHRDETPRVIFEPRTTIKGKVFADFIAEFTLGPPPQSNLLKGWIPNMDGTSYGRGIKIGVVLTIQDGSIIEQSYTLRFFAINNEVEFEKIFVGL